MLQLDDRGFNRLALAGLAVGLLLLTAAFLAAVTSINSSRRSTEMVRHTHQVVEQLSIFELQLERIENGRRGFLLAQHPYRLRLYRENALLAPRSLERIAGMVQDNPDQARRLEQIRGLMDQELRDARASIDLALSGRVDEAREQFATQSALTPIRKIRAAAAEMRAEENRLLAQRIAQEREVLKLVDAVLWVTGILLLILGPAIFWLVRRYTTDLGRARDRLHVLNTDLEGQVRTRTADLTRANAEIQRFAYIVSHDLRSPLVNVMGFTSELERANAAVGKLIERAETEAPQIIDDDARHAREDLPEAIGFIRSSTMKMDRLINAILKLSRQGQRTLNPEELPMSRMLTELSRSLEHMLDEKGAALKIDPALPNLVSDRLAIEQIFSNLLENAVKYLEPSRAGIISVRGWNQGERTVYEITDNGRGIDANDKERVFDLFRRAGRQDQPGEGIGLAHVRALVYRLGGLIDLESTPGEGTTFRLNLPAELETGAAH